MSLFDVSSSALWLIELSTGRPIMYLILDGSIDAG
jgi:hypothetical protein